MDIFVFRGPNGYLIPADERSQRFIERLKSGYGIKLSAKPIRNIRLHRKFFALVTVVCDNSDTIQSKEAALEMIKLVAGHFDLTERNGETIAVGRSIAFDAMDDAEFAEFVNDAITGTLRSLLPRMNRIALEEAIDRVMHFA